MSAPSHRRRPSPALIIACLALFVALGGGAYALSKNSVKSKQIKNGTVTSKDVKDNALKGKDVKDDNLKGADLDETSLGQVPSAATADAATTADTADTADAATTAASADDAKGIAGMKAARIDPLLLGNGQSKDLGSVGPLSLTARCRINDGGTDFAEIEIATTANNAAFDGANTDSDFDVADSPGIIVNAAAPTGTPTFDNETDGAAAAVSGEILNTDQAWAGVNVLNQPGKCAFGGTVYTSG